MRKALRPNPQKIQLARGVSIPAPVAGWDAISSQAAMPEDHAITLKNMFPQPGYVEIRGGAKRHRLTNGASKVETIMPYQGMVTNVLFSAAGGAIYDTTTAATATASIAVSGLTSARWQYVNFSGTGGHFLWIANGLDVPRSFNGSVWATLSITGPTASSIIQPAVYKRRIWLCIDGEISPYYLATDSIQGAAAQFPLTGVFEKGGQLQAIGTWNFGSDGPDNFIAFISSRGECAVYSGDDPTATDGSFALRGVYPLGEPLGRRCLTKLQGDLGFISIDGVVPLSRAVFTERAATQNIALTKNIQPVMNASARAGRANFGWQLISYPRGTRAILNYPVAEGSGQVQYIMNTVTGAWCEFEGNPANCWATFNDRLFFGGNNGYVYEADCQGFDDDGPIEFDLECAFNYCGARGQLKQWLQAQPIIATDGQVAPSVGLSVDFDRADDLSTPTPIASTQALWDVAVWDVDTWGTTRGMVSDWIGVAGLGYCASLRMKGSVSVGDGNAARALLLQLFGFNLQMVDGGLM